MSGDHKNIPIYSATDIQKYLKGELSAREMHDLEKAALEDPFLADALEGIELHQAHTDTSSEGSAIREAAGEFSETGERPKAGERPGAAVFRQDLDDLQARLAGRVNKTRSRSPLFFSAGWKIAAVVILLLGLGLTAYYTLLKADKRLAPLARTENRQAEAPTPQGKAADSISLAVPQATADATPSKPATPSKKADAKRLLKPVHAHPPEAVEAKTLSDSSALATAVTPPDSVKYTFLSRQASPALSKTAALNRKSASQDTAAYTAAYAAANAKDFKAQNLFTGKVVDASNNNPLAGVSLRLNGQGNIGTTTDRNGFFSLRLPNKDSAANLTVASVGYQQTSLVLTQDNRFSNLVQLRPQTTSMDEVVVIGYGSKRREMFRSDTASNEDKEKAIQRDVIAQKAAPAGGWIAYNNYLAANKTAPGLDTTLRGNETIAFRVNHKGVLSDFHVVQSLSTAHDTLLIRLVQQGPSWKLLKGKKAWASATLSF